MAESAATDPRLEPALAERGFAVLTDHPALDLWAGYDALASSGQPVLVTCDAMLSLWFEAHRTVTTDLEAERLLPLTCALLAAAAEHAHDGPESERVAFGVAWTLSGAEPELPLDVAIAVDRQVAKIEDATAIELYPGDDYTQYKPRGNYDRSDATRRYFRLTKWLGRHLLPLVGFGATPETLRSAAWWVDLLRRCPAAMAAWQQLADTRRYLVGPFNAISIDELARALAATLGEDWQLAGLDDAACGRLSAELRQPGYTATTIRSGIALPGEYPTHSFAVLPEHGLPDSALHQRLIDAQVQPSGLAVAAAIGLPRAAELSQAVEPLAVDLANLYGQWLHTLAGLGEIDPRAPEFMHQAPWQHKTLGTALASWAQLRHNYVLYGAEAYYAFGGPAPQLGFVEPVPEFWRRYRAMAEEFLSRLERLGAGPQSATTVGTLAEKAGDLERYAELQLAGQPLPGGGADLQRFSTFILNLPFDKPRAVVDVATTDDGVLYAACGDFDEIVVRFPPLPGDEEAAPADAHGYVASYYEFWRPQGERLDNTQWGEMLDMAHCRPERPRWTASYLLEPDDDDPELAAAERMALDGDRDAALALLADLRGTRRGTAGEADVVRVQAAVLERGGWWPELFGALEECSEGDGELADWAEQELARVREKAEAERAREEAHATWIAELAATEPHPGLTRAEEQARQDRRLRALLDPDSNKPDAPDPARAVRECRDSRLWPVARLIEAAGDLADYRARSWWARRSDERTEEIVRALAAIERDYQGSAIGEHAAAWLLKLTCESQPLEALRRVEPYLTSEPAEEPYPEAAELATAYIRGSASSAKDALRTYGRDLRSALYHAGDFETYLHVFDLCPYDQKGPAAVAFVRYFHEHEPEALRLFAAAGVEYAVRPDTPRVDAATQRERLLELLERYPASPLAPLALDVLREHSETHDMATARLLCDYPLSQPALLASAEEAQASGDYERALALVHQAMSLRGPWRGSADAGWDGDPESAKRHLLYCVDRYGEVAATIAPLLGMSLPEVALGITHAVYGDPRTRQSLLSEWKRRAGEREPELLTALAGMLGEPSL